MKKISFKFRRIAAVAVIAASLFALAACAKGDFDTKGKASVTLDFDKVYAGLFINCPEGDVAKNSDTQYKISLKNRKRVDVVAGAEGYKTKTLRFFTRDFLEEENQSAGVSLDVEYPTLTLEIPNVADLSGVKVASTNGGGVKSVTVGKKSLAVELDFRDSIKLAVSCEGYKSANFELSAEGFKNRQSALTFPLIRSNEDKGAVIIKNDLGLSSSLEVQEYYPDKTVGRISFGGYRDQPYIILNQDKNYRLNQNYVLSEERLRAETYVIINASDLVSSSNSFVPMFDARITSDTQFEIYQAYYAAGSPVVSKTKSTTLEISSYDKYLAVFYDLNGNKIGLKRLSSNDFKISVDPQTGVVEAEPLHISPDSDISTRLSVKDENGAPSSIVADNNGTVTTLESGTLDAAALLSLFGGDLRASDDLHYIFVRHGADKVVSENFPFYDKISVIVYGDISAKAKVRFLDDRGVALDILSNGSSGIGTDGYYDMGFAREGEGLSFHFKELASDYETSNYLLFSKNVFEKRDDGNYYFDITLKRIYSLTVTVNGFNFNNDSSVNFNGPQFVDYVHSSDAAGNTVYIIEVYGAGTVTIEIYADNKTYLGTCHITEETIASGEAVFDVTILN